METSDTQDTVMQTLFTTPALTLDTPRSNVEQVDTLLTTPNQNVRSEDVSASFLIPSTSYEIMVRFHSA